MKKKALIIGASTGLGLHIAQRLAEDDWEVTATARRERPLSDNSAGFRYHSADLASEEGLAFHSKLLNDTPPRLLFFNAALYSASAPNRMDALQTVYRVNAIAPFVLISDYLEHLRKTDDQTRTSCVIANSDSIYHASRHSTHYAASKAALRVLTSSLADLAKGTNVTVSTLHLGPLADEKKKAEISRIAEKKGVSDEKVTKIFLNTTPSYVIEDFIDLEECYSTLVCIASLGRASNGMQCKLDGGSSGSFS
jgi:NAD(P)-dependent dehydrogenase (short-subunit alcohol dehydrogenase family)